jgi:hypothetical protein
VLRRITHFAKNNFVDNHKDDHKISGGSLCQKYLWHFGIFSHEPQGLWGALDVFGNERTHWLVVGCLVM